MDTITTPYLITIDPGSKNAGVACWLNGTLVAASVFPDVGGALDRGLLRSLVFGETPTGFNGLAPTTIVCERPIRHTDAEGARVGIESLLTLTRAAGALAGAFSYAMRAPVVWVPAQEWKGGLPKPKRAQDPYLVETRARACLSPGELSRVVDPGSVSAGRWDVWDAIGIGLVATGRASRGVVWR